MGKVKDALLSELHAHEGLHLWGCLNTVAQAVVHEVLTTGDSETMNELLSTIQRLYDEQRPEQLYS